MKNVAIEYLQRGAYLLNHHFQCCNVVPHYNTSAYQDRKTEHCTGHYSQSRCLHSLIAETWCVYSILMMENSVWGGFSATFSLADAIFRVLQTKPLVKRQLDPHVSGSHKSPDHLCTPGICTGEVWAVDHSFTRHCYDLLLMGILHSWKGKEQCLLFAGLHMADELAWKKSFWSHRTPIHYS